MAGILNRYMRAAPGATEHQSETGGYPVRLKPS